MDYVQHSRFSMAANQLTPKIPASPVPLLASLSLEKNFTHYTIFHSHPARRIQTRRNFKSFSNCAAFARLTVTNLDYYSGKTFMKCINRGRTSSRSSIPTVLNQNIRKKT